MKTVSAIIITYNEEKNLRRCLRSLTWVDEIIVVDAFSTDQTLAIANEFDAHMYQNAWPGFVGQKNFALRKATGDWIVSLDADEELEPHLIEEIQKGIRTADDKVEGFMMRQKCFYLGKWIIHGEWYPDWKLRVFRREKAVCVGENIHESFVVSGKIQQIDGHILHYSFEGIRDHVHRMNRYSTIIAQNLYRKGEQFSFLKMIYAPLKRGFQNYVLRGGFRAGIRGFIINLLIMYYVFLQHAKLLQYHLEKNLSAKPGKPFDH